MTVTIVTFFMLLFVNAKQVIAGMLPITPGYYHHSYYSDLERRDVMDETMFIQCNEDGSIYSPNVSGPTVSYGSDYCASLITDICKDYPKHKFVQNQKITADQYMALQKFYSFTPETLTATKVNTMCEKNIKVLK